MLFRTLARNEERVVRNRHWNVDKGGVRVIARFQVLLPFSFHRAAGAEMGVWNTTVGEYAVTIHPPQQALVPPEDLSGTSPVPLVEAMRGVRPNPDPKVATGIELGGEPSIPLNLLVIDFRKDDFDRSADGGDPPFALAFELANDILARLRSILRVASIRPIPQVGTPARCDYLNDDGTPVEPDGVTPRSHVLGSFQFGVVALRSDAWTEAASLPTDFESPAWDEMLLDATDVLPRIEAATVLAFAALEAFIDWALEEFVQEGRLDAALYKWIAERDDFAKRPSPKEQFDILLRTLGGKSLKDETDLWELFSSLYQVRNKSVHEGRATLGGVPVSFDKAKELVGGARRIIEWAEQLMPPEKRRPPAIPTEVIFTKALTGPGATDSDSELTP